MAKTTTADGDTVATVTDDEGSQVERARSPKPRSRS
jgi:hypothetical protein